MSRPISQRRALKKFPKLVGLKVYISVNYRLPWTPFCPGRYLQGPYLIALQVDETLPVVVNKYSEKCPIF